MPIICLVITNLLILLQYLFDMLDTYYYPLVVLQLFNALFKPFEFLRILILKIQQDKSNILYCPLVSIHCKHTHTHTHLWTTVIEYFYMSNDCLFNNVIWRIVAMCQIPKQIQDLAGHHAFFVVFRQGPYQVQELFTLLFRRICPIVLKTAEQMVQLFGCEVPCKFAEQVVHIFLDRLVFVELRLPNPVQILQRQRFLLDQKSQDFLKLFDILRLMHAISKYNVEHIVVLYPFLQNQLLKLKSSENHGETWKTALLPCVR